jgi:hypothetical protein
MLWVLLSKTQTKTAVGARISAMPKYVIARACGNYYLKVLVFDYFTANFARHGCFCFFGG